MKLFVAIPLFALLSIAYGGAKLSLFIKDYPILLYTPKHFLYK